MWSGSFVLMLVACEARPPAPVPVVRALPPMVDAPTALASSPIEPGDATAVAVFALRRGESLAHFARWSGLPVEKVAETSGLSLDEVLAVGTEVRLPLDAAARATLESKRDAHHVLRAESYLTSRGGSLGSEFHRVRTGDTAWSVAKETHLPVWLLETYNPSVDLDALRPGMDLLVPVIADTVATTATTTELEPGRE